MEKFDFEDESVERAPSRFNFLDVLTALVLIATLAISAYVVYVYINPTTPLNPFYPKVPTPFAFPTPTITPLQQEPTWTPTLVVVTDTATLVPTITLQPSSTVISLGPPSKTPPASPKPQAAYSITVSYVDSTTFHPEAGCAWFGIAGTVKDTNNAGIVGKLLRLTGVLNGKPLDMPTASNAANGTYGDGGFEFVLGTAPVASTSQLTLQLQELDGRPLADPVYIATYNDCKRNLIIVRFKKNG